MDSILEFRKARGIGPDKLLQFLVRRPIAERVLNLSGGDTEEAARLLKAFPLSPKGVKGWDFAQVTKGGRSP